MSPGTTRGPGQPPLATSADCLPKCGRHMRPFPMCATRRRRFGGSVPQSKDSSGFPQPYSHCPSEPFLWFNFGSKHCFQQACYMKPLCTKPCIIHQQRSRLITGHPFCRVTPLVLTHCPDTPSGKGTAGPRHPGQHVWVSENVN